MEELALVDLPILISVDGIDDLVPLFLFDVLYPIRQDGFELLSRNGSVLIGVEQLEGLLQFVFGDFLALQHSICYELVVLDSPGMIVVQLLEDLLCDQGSHRVAV